VTRICITTAVLGSLVLMVVMAYRHFSMDGRDLPYCVLNRGRDTRPSRGTTLNLAGSRYFIEHAPLNAMATLTGAALGGAECVDQFPPGIRCVDLDRGDPVADRRLIDGSMPTRAEDGCAPTCRRCMASGRRTGPRRALRSTHAAPTTTIETRFRLQPRHPQPVGDGAGRTIPTSAAVYSRRSWRHSGGAPKRSWADRQLLCTPVTRLEFLVGQAIALRPPWRMVNYVLLTLRRDPCSPYPLKRQCYGPGQAAPDSTVILRPPGLAVRSSTPGAHPDAAIVRHASATDLAGNLFWGCLDPVGVVCRGPAR